MLYEFTETYLLQGNEQQKMFQQLHLERKEVEIDNSVALFIPLSHATPPTGKWRCFMKPFGLKIIVLKRGLKFDLM